MVNGSTTQAMSLSSAGIFGIGSTSQFAVGATGIMTAGTVPLARMMSTEQTLTGTTTLTFGSIDVEVGDKILVTGSLNAGTAATSLTWAKASGTAAVNWGGNTSLIAPGSGTLAVCSGVCSVVTTAGTLVISLTPAGTGTLNTYGQIIVLHGV